VMCLVRGQGRWSSLDAYDALCSREKRENIKGVQGPFFCLEAKAMTFLHVPYSLGGRCT